MKISLCSVQPEEGVTPQRVQRAEGAASLWSSAVMLCIKHCGGILNTGLNPWTPWCCRNIKAEEENKFFMSAAVKTHQRRKSRSLDCVTKYITHTKSCMQTASKGPTIFNGILMYFKHFDMLITFCVDIKHFRHGSDFTHIQYNSWKTSNK